MKTDDAFLRSIGFIHATDIGLCEGRLFANYDAVTSAVGVYAFVVEGQAIYVGSSVRRGKGIRARIRKYCKPRDFSVRAYRPVHAVIRQNALQGRTIEVWQLDTDSLSPDKDSLAPVSGGLKVDLVLGIEGWLIRKFNAPANPRTMKIPNI